MATVEHFYPLAAPFNLTSFLIFSDSIFFFWSKLLQLQGWKFCGFLFSSSKNAESEHTEYSHAEQNRAWAPFTNKIRVFSSLVASLVSYLNKHLVIEFTFLICQPVQSLAQLWCIYFNVNTEL